MPASKRQPSSQVSGPVTVRRSSRLNKLPLPVDAPKLVSSKEVSLKKTFPKDVSCKEVPPKTVAPKMVTSKEISAKSPYNSTRGEPKGANSKHGKSNQKPRIGFAIDMDGVLVKLRRHTGYNFDVALSGAKEALTRLNTKKIPYILFTNQCHYTDKGLSDDIENLFGFRPLSSQLVFSESPLKQLFPELSDNNVLLIGEGEQEKWVLEHLGFNKVLSAGDVLARYPGLRNRSSRPNTRSRDKSKDLGLQIHAVIVCEPAQDPSAKTQELELVNSLLLSKEGRLGTKSAFNGKEDLPNRGYLQEKQPKIYLAYAASSGRQCDFMQELHTLWRKEIDFAKMILNKWGTEDGAHFIALGKAFGFSYAYAESVLREVNRGICKESGHEEVKLDKVYIIGDTIAADVLGPEIHNKEGGSDLPWESIVVLTGESKESEKHE